MRGLVLLKDGSGGRHVAMPWRRREVEVEGEEEGWGVVECVLLLIWSDK